MSAAYTNIWGDVYGGVNVDLADGRCVDLDATGGKHTPEQAAEADAIRRVLLAAPDLLEALKLALASHNMRISTFPGKGAWHANDVEMKARAAIAKATGVAT